MFYTGAIRHQEPSSYMVFFSAISGTVTVENFGSAIGDMISGTFDVSIQGLQGVCSGDDCEEDAVWINGPWKEISTVSSPLRATVRSNQKNGRTGYKKGRQP